MSELQRLADADHRYGEAVEMLRDLLEPQHRDRLMLALKVAGGPEVEDMQDTLRFLDWLFTRGQAHLDALLADIHGIDLAQVKQELEAARQRFLKEDTAAVMARAHARLAQAARERLAGGA